jgi:hypothetical protein
MLIRMYSVRSIAGWSKMGSACWWNLGAGVIGGVGT